MSSPAAFITVRQAAQRAGVAVVTMRRWLTEGRLRKYHRGPTQRVLVAVDELEASLRVTACDDFVPTRDRS